MPLWVDRLICYVAVQSTTPTGTPPQEAAMMAGTAKPPAAPIQDTSSILANLQALANMSKSAPHGGPSVVPAQAGNPNNVSFPQTAFPQPAVNPVPTMQQAPPAVNGAAPAAGNGLMFGGIPPNMFNPGGQVPQQPVVPQNNVPGLPDALQQQLQILGTLKAQGIPESQWPAILSALMASSNPAAVTANQPQPTNVSGEPSRDRNGYEQYNMRSPPGGRFRGRSRSRSPRGWDRRRENSPPARRRDSPVYGEYGGNRERDHDRDRDFGRRGGRNNNREGGRGGDFRRRSPDRFRRSPSPRRGSGGGLSVDQQLPAPGPKWVEYDHTLPKGNIKGKDPRPAHFTKTYTCVQFSAELSLLEE